MRSFDHGDMFIHIGIKPFLASLLKSNPMQDSLLADGGFNHYLLFSFWCDVKLHFWPRPPKKKLGWPINSTGPTWNPPRCCRRPPPPLQSSTAMWTRGHVYGRVLSWGPFFLWVGYTKGNQKEYHQFWGPLKRDTPISVMIVFLFLGPGEPRRGNALCSDLLGGRGWK